MHDGKSSLLREQEQDVYETLYSELGLLAVHCACSNCPELPLALRASLYEARIERRCGCGDAGCRAVRFVHECDDTQFNTIPFDMPLFHALVIGFCSKGHVVDVDWLEDVRISRM